MYHVQFSGNHVYKSKKKQVKSVLIYLTQYAKIFSFQQVINILKISNVLLYIFSQTKCEKAEMFLYL